MNLNAFKLSTPIVIISILIFHIAITAHAIYSLFSDFTVWTFYMFYPMMLLIFTLVWLGITFKKRVFAFAYFMLVFFEVAMKLFFGRYLFGEVFGEVLFPIDLLFSFVILLLYKPHFGDRTASIS